LNPVQAGRSWRGLLAAAAGVAVLTAFASLVPQGGRKLLLFSLLYGLSVGALVSWSAREFALGRRSASLLAGCLIMAGLAVIAAQGHRQLLSEYAAAARSDPKQALGRRILEAAAEHEGTPASPDAERLDDERGGAGPSFFDYLALRVQPLGEWPRPWPEVFWGFEVALAAAAGGWLTWRLPPPAARQFEEHVDEHA